VKDRLDRLYAAECLAGKRTYATLAAHDALDAALCDLDRARDYVDSYDASFRRAEARDLVRLAEDRVLAAADKVRHEDTILRIDVRLDDADEVVP
jgi:hypothetical protein